MLILTRRVGETIIIEIPAGERIGTEAPEDVTILRKELAGEQL